MKEYLSIDDHATRDEIWVEMKNKIMDYAELDGYCKKVGEFIIQ
jgi:hypothetical protein